MRVSNRTWLGVMSVGVATLAFGVPAALANPQPAADASAGQGELIIETIGEKPVSRPAAVQEPSKR